MKKGDQDPAVRSRWSEVKGTASSPNGAASRTPLASFLSLSLSLLLLFATPCLAQTQPTLDTIFLLRGDKMAAKVVAIEGPNIRVQRALPPLPGAPATAAPVFATVSIARAEVDRIEFAPDEARDRKIAEATVAQLPELELLWKRHEAWLGLPKSPAGTIGLAYGDLLLRSGDPANATKALALFRQIETTTWNDDNLMMAKQGRLRAMVATGNAKDAVTEAAELAKLSEDPAVLVEAKYILAEAADQGLRKLVAENPRWEEDVFVIPERNRLYNDALDLYLHPYLFFGSETEAAARGLWGACGVYDFTGDPAHAAELARDLVAIYPGTKYASLAQKFLDALPKEIRNQDNEKDARADAEPPSKKP